MELMAAKTDVTKKELIQFQRNAFNISWISSWKRNHFLSLLDVYDKRMITETENGTSMVNGNDNGV
jgi:adenosine deaminase